MDGWGQRGGGLSQDRERLVSARLLWSYTPLLVQGAGVHQFDHEEGIAFRLVVKCVDSRCIKGVSRDLLRQGDRLGGTEWLKSQFYHQALWLPGAQDRHQGMSREHLLRAHSSNDEQACVRRKAKQVVQPFQCLRVAPVQVIQHEEQRLTGAEQRTREGLEEALALPALPQFRGTRDVWPRRLEFWKKPCNFCEKEWIEGEDVGMEGLAA